MIRALLFDIGNVLLKFDFLPALKAVAADSEIGELTEVLARIDPLKVAYEDGQIDRASFLRGAVDAVGYRGSERKFVEAWEDIFELNAPMAKLVGQLHGRYPLYLLSNTSDIHREYVFRRYPVFSHFAAGIYSYAVRASKPGRPIYEIAIRQLGLDPASTFFIDDLLLNIETAREIGFPAHQYHYDRHDLLLADLAAAGIEP